MARIYWQDHKLRSIGLRPYIVYGAGRDQGVTSTPTKAMLAAVLGRDYRITYGGRVTMQYARDAADIFIRAARAAGAGARVYNLGGSVTTVPDIVREIERSAPESKGRITFETNALPYPSEYDTRALEQALGAIRWTPLQDGVRETIEIFRAAVKANRINVERALG
jgi:nucleoside-diphosphate-sugar epimerase